MAHNTIDNIHSALNVVGLALDAKDTGHGSVLNYGVVNHNKYVFAGWDPLTGAKSLGANDHYYLTGDKIDIEVSGSPWDPIAHVLDANGSIRGKLAYHIWPIGTAITVTGGQNFHFEPTGGTKGILTTYHPFTFASAIASTAVGTSQNWYAVQFRLPQQTLLTGVRYRVGGTAAGNVFSGLYDQNFQQIVNAAGALGVGTANQVQAVPFANTYLAQPGTYYALLRFSTSTATFWGGRNLGAVDTGNGSPNPSSIFAGIQNVDVPVMQLY
jgi:hypothetical protein